LVYPKNLGRESVIKLREHERKTILSLERLGGKGGIDEIIEISDIAHAAVMRSSLSLVSKNLVKLSEHKEMEISLSEEGRLHAKKGLPERRLLVNLIRLGGKTSFENAVKAAGLDEKFSSVALGWLRSKDWVVMDGKDIFLKSMQEPSTGADERLLLALYEKGSLNFESLSQDLKNAMYVLKKRGLLRSDEKIRRNLELTDMGWDLIKRGVKKIDEVSQLTPNLIISGNWRKVKLRRFNVEASGPIVYPGKMHPAAQIVKKVKEIFSQMGFTEIRGPIVETAFWNFDVLFQPQDHPAREMMDTFYLAWPNDGGLPSKEIVERVSKTHENGWTTGSIGWRYKWEPNESKKIVLRTHTTSVTIRYLSEHKEPPVKVFSVDRVYRNEKVDYKHLAEFHQIEGIIMDKGITLRDLMGTLKEFYLKLGLEKIQFWPSYFPYTEPSVQTTAYVPELKAWVELCGMGMFRPEVLKPLGIKYPVLAWGGGLERIIMLKLGVDDIRFLYKNDLGWIRRTPVCQ
jgi:phenylalanyl-tRNA synthetase alpha chain